MAAMVLSAQEVITAISVFVAFLSMVILATKSRFDAKRGIREIMIAEKAQQNDDAETTIALLREQADILRKHRDEREAEIKLEKAEYRERERKMERRYEARLIDVEERMRNAETAYTALVLTVTTMSFCAKAASCPNVDSGDRRSPMTMSAEE